MPAFEAEDIPQPGLVFPPSQGTAWDAGGVSNPVVSVYSTASLPSWLAWQLDVLYMHCLLVEP